MKNQAFLSKKSHIVALIVVLSLLTIFTSYLYYRYQTKNLRQSKQEELQAIAHLKLNQLMRWRQERSADAAVMSQRRFFLLRLDQWLRDRDNVKLSAAILEDLKMVQQAYNYESIVLSSVDSKLLLSSDDNLVHFDSLTNKKIKAAVDNGQITHSDFYYCNLENKIHYDVIAPLLNAGNRLIAVLILRSSPEEFVFPLMQSWPTPNKTAETLIVRQEGDSVLFLNNLRHLTDTALKLRFPLTAKEVPAVQAILGYQGIWGGKDYLAKDVLADIRPVPNTPWYMISKIDKSELFREFYVEIFYLIIFTILVIGTISAGLSFVYSSRQRNIYRRLWQSHQEFKTTLYSIGDAVITTDILGRIKYLNPVAEKLTGWREPSATGKALSKVFRIVNEETHNPVESPVERVLKEGVVVGLANHTLLISRDGKENPIADSGAPIKDENGKIVGVVLVFRDQTEEREAQKTLRESERKLSTLMSNLQGMVYSCLNDRDWTMKFVSQGLFGLTGYLPGELIENKVISYNELIHPEDQQYVWDAVQAALKTQSAYTIEYRIIARDKVVKWVWERGQGVFSADGELQGLEGFISDITERKRAEEQLAKYREQLEELVKARTEDLHEKIEKLDKSQKALLYMVEDLNKVSEELKKRRLELETTNKELESFSYSVSHDLRAPLRSIDGFSRFLQEGYADKLDEKGLHYLERVRAASQRMGRLIDDLLALSRTARKTMKWEPLNLSKLAEEVIAELREQDPDRDVETDIVDGKTVTGDAQLLKTVMENLLGNAWKFTKQRKKAKIVFGVVEKNREQQFFINDNGAGFDPNYADKLFTPFQRLHSAEEFPGTGIGLANVRRIISRHGGRVWAESDGSGKGATVYFVI